MPSPPAQPSHNPFNLCTWNESSACADSPMNRIPKLVMRAAWEKRGWHIQD